MPQSENEHTLAELQRINDETEEFMRESRKKMDHLCDTPDDVISFKSYQIVSVITLIVVIIALTKTFLV